MDSLVASDPLAAAEGLGDAIRSASDTIERTRRIPEPLLGRLHAARLFRMLLPASAGGDEVEPCTYLKAIEEIGRHDGSLAWNMFVANSASLIAAYLPPEIGRTIYADPRTIIAWGPPNASTAVAVSGGYRVSGRWDFASGCRQANWMGAHCHVREADGALRQNNHGRATVRTLLFPADGATLIDTWDTIGMRGTASDSYTVGDLFVAEPFSTTREDPCLRREPARLYAFPMQTLYAVGVAGVALGIARAMLDEFMTLARDKTPRGLGRLADSPVVQADVARAEARLGAARAFLLDRLATIHGEAGESEPIDVPARARVRLACSHAIESAEAVAGYTYKAAGVDGIFVGRGPFERRFRDMHTLSQQIQSRAAHFEAVGQVMLGIPPAVFL